MADATARFAVELAASAPGVDATATAAERLRAKIQEDNKAVTELQKALKNLKGGASVDVEGRASVNIETLRDLQKQLDLKKLAIAGNTEAYVGLGGKVSDLSTKFKTASPAASKTSSELETVASKAEEASTTIGDMAGAAQAAGGPMGGLVSRAQQLVQVLGKTGVAGAVVLAVVAVAAIIGVVFAATYALASFALQASDAARSAGILRDAATGSAAAGARLGAEVGRLAARIATPRAEIEALALALARSGLSGNALETALSAVGTTAAVMGQAAGSALQGIIERSRVSKRFLLNALDLTGTGIALKDVGAAVAKRLGISTQAAIAALQNGQVKLADGIAALDDVAMAKFGPAAAAQMLELPNQILKAKEALQVMFSKVKIDGFLKALHSVLSLLDESSVSGKALKHVVEGLLNPLFDAVATAGPFVRAFFEGVIIAALKFAIGVVKVRNALNDAFGGKGKSDIVTLENAMLAGQVAAVVLGIAVAALTVGLVLLGVALFLVALPFLMIAALIGLIVYGAYRLGSAFSGLAPSIGGSLGEVLTTVKNFVVDAAAYLADLPMRALEAGGNFVLGLLQAITTGKGPVADAVKGLAKSAVSALWSALKISSPSRVTGQAGHYFTAGFVRSVHAGEDEAAEAGQGMALAAADGLGQGASSSSAVTPAAGATDKGGRSIVLNWSGDLNVNGRKQLRDPDLETELADLFGRALQRAGA